MANRYVLDRAKLKGVGASRFNEGDLIAVSNYIIEIRYGKYTRPTKTVVYDKDTKTKLPPAKQPQYIRDFIFR